MSDVKEKTESIVKKRLEELYKDVSQRPHEIKDDLYLGYDVYIEGSCFRQGAIEMLARAGCRGAKDVKSADFVLFLGGADINPKLYGEEPIPATYWDDDHDARDKRTFDECVKNGIPMFGICRGMQFLHAMDGHKLYQHVDNHTRAHEIVDIWGNKLTCSSMHHQMCIEDDKMFPVAHAIGVAGRYCLPGKQIKTDSHRDLEAAVYPNIRAFAVQGHPEVGGYPDYTDWCLRNFQTFMEEMDVFDTKYTVATKH